jgi:outer membrane receptor protein involved in Fe transport
MEIKRKAVCLLLLFVCCGFASRADHPLGEIRGFVRDAATGEAITGARVMIKDSGRGTVSNIDGFFSIGEVAEGRYRLVFSYVSYKTVEVEYGLERNAPELSVAMENDVKEVGEVVVTARMRSGTETAMLSTVKSLLQVASGISAAQISKSADRNAAEVVRRVPGVSVIDDRFIIVRGLSQRYNNAWINGLPVPGTETDSRAFPFDLIPGSQIDNMVVYKSPSPEIPGDFSGGFVKIASKSIPDENRIEADYSTGFNVGTHFHDFKMNPGSATDFLGFDVDKRPLPDKTTRLVHEDFNDDWRIKTSRPAPDRRFSFMIARRMEMENGATAGNVTAINYSNTNRTVSGMKNIRYGLYSAADDAPVFLDNYVDNRFSNDVRLGAIHNLCFVPNPSHSVEWKNLVNVLGSNRLTLRTGIRDMSSMYYREQTEMLYSSRLVYSGQLSGVHRLAANRTLAWDAGYSYANKTEPDRRIITNYAGIGSEADVAFATMGNDHISRYFQDMYDHTFSAALNYRHTFAKVFFAPVVKAGFYGERRDRSYSPREFIYRYNRLAYDERQIYLQLPFAEMLGAQYMGDDGVYIDEIARKTNAYSALVDQLAGYAALEIAVGRMNVYAGLRVENYRMVLFRDRADALDIVLKTNKRVNDRDWLPSVNVVYKFTDRHQLRAAYGRSLNRPELRELSPAVYFDFDLFNEIGGNENLETARIDNLDLRYECYPGAGEGVSLGMFYKHFRRPIEWTFIDMGGSLRYRYENADRAESFGLEADVRKQLDFIGMPAFTWTLNVALIKSKVRFRPGEIVVERDRPMQGQSPYVINSGLYYRSERWGISLSLLYNRIGKRIVGIGKSIGSGGDINSLIPDSYEMPRNDLDFTFGKSLGRGWEIRLSVRDVFGEDVVFMQFPRFERDGIVYERRQTTRQYAPRQSVAMTVAWKIH